jgi:hypothetical protein
LPLGPPEFSVFAAQNARVAADELSSCGIGCSFRVSDRKRYRPYWLDAPALSLALTSTVRFSLNRLRWSQLSGQPSPLREFRLPPEFCPANPSRSAATDQLLSWTLVPYSTRGFGGLLAAGFPSLATFRLQGLATLLAVYSLRARVGFISHRRRSWDSPFGAFPSRKVSGAFPPGSTHLPSLLPLYQPHKATGRPDRPRFLGFDPSESSSRSDERLTRQPPDTPLGFAPSRVCRRKP